MGNDNSKDITNKIGTEVVRDENGRVVAGVLNPNGRPKKGLTLTDIAKEILEEELPSGVTRKEALMRKIATLAYDGNETMIKMIWNYVDGMPVQRSVLAGDEEHPVQIDVRSTLDKIYGSVGEMPTNSQE